MDCEHMKTPDGVEVLIRKAENGFVVEVDYPRRMIPNPQMDKVKTLFSSITKGMGPDAEHDHTAFMKTIGDTISGLARPDKPLRKAHEEYVFQSMEAMMAFIKETIESADAAENAPAQK